jgi:DNA-binding MarR family transcriptional regulator
MKNEIKGIQIKILEATIDRPLNIQEIKSKVGVAYDYARIEIKEMINKNLINESFSPRDNRIKLIYPTKSGILILKKTKIKKNVIARFDAFLEENLEEIGKQLESEFSSFIRITRRKQ